jgi:hypothetical protein
LDGSESPALQELASRGCWFCADAVNARERSASDDESERHGRAYAIDRGRQYVDPPTIQGTRGEGVQLTSVKKEVGENAVK